MPCQPVQLQTGAQKHTDLDVRIMKRLGMKNTYLASSAALLNIVVLGMATAYPSIAIADMKKSGSRFRNVTSNQVAWIASLPGITAIFGNLFSGYLSLKLGRKAVLIYASGPYMASWLMIAYAPSIPWIYAGRLFSGLCTGICSVAVPAYVTEIAPVERRGLLGSFYQLSYTIGILIAMILAMILRWSWLAIIGALFVIASTFLMYFMPESPPWLVISGREAEAVEGFQFFKGKNADILKEFSAHVRDIGQPPQNSISLKEFQEAQLYKPIALAVGLMFFQQFSGINALLSYTVEIFEHAESSLDPMIASAIVAGAQVISTLIGSTLMDKAGRRVLYITSGSFVTFGLLILGIYGIVNEKINLDPDVFGWIPLTGFIIFVSSFSLGFGPIPYLMTPELVPTQSRSAVLAIASIFSSLFQFIVTKTFDDLRYFVSDYGVYWVYGFSSILGCIFCWFCLPETKGKTINEIQQSFVSNRDEKLEDVQYDGSIQ